LRSSAAHPVCAHCDAGFMTEAGYLSVRHYRVPKVVVEC
jgi:hypothetical protein